MRIVDSDDDSDDDHDEPPGGQDQVRGGRRGHSSITHRHPEEGEMTQSILFGLSSNLRP